MIFNPYFAKFAISIHKTVKMKKLLFALAIFSLLSLACNNKEKSTENTGQDINVTGQDKTLVFPLPTPYEINYVIQRAKVSFNPELLNPVDNAKNYVSDLAKAVNIGIYGADLSYANVFNQSQITLEYFNVVKKLSEDIGLSTLFPDQFIQRIENNIDQPDSLYKLATETYYKTYSYLVNRGKGDVAAIILAGSFVEGVYLAGNAAKDSPMPELIYKKIAEQSFASTQLVEILKKNSRTSSDAEKVLEQIQSLDAHFRKIQYIDDQPVYNPDDMNQLIEKATEIRNSFVNLE